MTVQLGQMKYAPWPDPKTVLNPLSDYLLANWPEMGHAMKDTGVLITASDPEGIGFLRGLAAAGVSGAKEMLQAIRLHGGVRVKLYSLPQRPLPDDHDNPRTE